MGVHAPAWVKESFGERRYTQIERDAPARHSILREMIHNRDERWEHFRAELEAEGWDYGEIADEWFSPDM